MADVGGIAGDRLKSFIERIERLEEEKKAIAADIKEVYGEATGTGFDAKTIREIVKLRRMTASERAEREALLDIYKAALGMLEDTPLGRAAIDRLSGKPAGKEPPPPAPSGAAPDDEAEAAPSEPAPQKPTVDEARQMGIDAAGAGKRIVDNPFTAMDPNRAAWEEGWCGATGTDGMEVPEAWRRAKKPKKPDGDGGAESRAA